MDRHPDRAAIIGRGQSELSDYLARNPDFVRQARPLATITDVNPALQKMAGAGDSSIFLDNVDQLLGESDRTFLGALVAFAHGEPFYEGETELVGLDGGRVPVLFTITFPPEADGDRNVLAFVVDITERRQSQDALLAAQAELAHAARVATLGELTASIAHEVNQPLAAIVTSGEAGLRWLRRDMPDLEEVAATINRVVAEGRRASEIVTRIRTFLKKQPAQQDRLEIGEIIEEAALLVERELANDDIVLTVEIKPGLPPIRGDRIQLQQVLVNLMVNAGQAMSDQSGPRLVTVRAGQPTAADSPSRCRTTVLASRPMTCRACSNRSSRPSTAEWAWDLRSVERRWKLTAGNCRRRAHRARAQLPPDATRHPRARSS